MSVVQIRRGEILHRIIASHTIHHPPGMFSGKVDGVSPKKEIVNGEYEK